MEPMPKLIKQVNSVSGLTEQERFVLSLVDGKTSVKEIARVTGFGLISVNKILEKMSSKKVVEFQHAKSSIQSQPQSDEQKRTQQSIKDFFATYENADPSAILGVPENAALEQIKEAYFEKTKMFHPDSYYARSVPPEDKHFLVDIYKKVQQAYETLKAQAPQKKTAVTRSEQKPAPANVPLKEDTVTHEKATAKTDAQHIITDQIKDRVKKAATYYKLGIEAFMHNDYSNAYINLKLANSYNPYDKEYINKMQEAERHMKADRYDDLLKKADICIELNKPEDAIGYLKSALELANDKKLLYYKLASVLYDFNQSLKDAKQYSQQAVELDPKNPDYHILLAKIYKKAGFPKSSLFEYEQVIALGVKTDDIKAEIKQLKGLIK
jgi:tetratricopeptide (TPR) repeat protein